MGLGQMVGYLVRGYKVLCPEEGCGLTVGAPGIGDRRYSGRGGLLPHPEVSSRRSIAGMVEQLTAASCKRKSLIQAQLRAGRQRSRRSDTLSWTRDL